MAAHVPVLDPTKLRQARGDRTLRDVVAATAGRISIQQLHAYETGQYRPKPENLPVLLEALGVDFDQVATTIATEPVETAAVSDS